MEIAILTEMRIFSEIAFYPTGNGDNQYCVFRVCSIYPNRNVHFTGGCRAANDACLAVQRLKLHKGSHIDLSAEIVQHPKNDHMETSYEIKSISISHVPSEFHEEVKDTLSGITQLVYMSSKNAYPTDSRETLTMKAYITHRYCS